MNQNAISRYENVEREADYETLIKFADYFNVSLDYLLLAEPIKNKDLYAAVRIEVFFVYRKPPAQLVVMTIYIILTYPLRFCMRR